MYSLDKHPDDIWICRLLGIDNGTTHVGFTILDYNIRTGKSTIVECEGYSVPRDYKDIREALHFDKGALAARLDMIKHRYLDVLDEFRPNIVGCESPFSHINIRTYRILLQAMNMFNDATYSHDRSLEFYEVSPGEAKAAVTHTEKYTSKKEGVHLQILSHPDLLNPNGIDLDAIGPDALDSISVAMALINRVVI